VNNDPVIGMRLFVLPSDRPAFEATIDKTPISRLAVPQFQPGSLVPVRFDPQNPSHMAVDFEGKVPENASPSGSGNPYQDHFERRSQPGAAFQPPPPSPEIYLGTSDNTDDDVAMLENGYGYLGGSDVSQDGANPEQAFEAGKEIGAAVVVVYGHFAPFRGAPLVVLPLRRSPQTASGGGSTADLPDESGMTMISSLAAEERIALYWGKLRPATLGTVTRPMNEQERARWKRNGVVVDSVKNGSPAAAAHIERGDLVVAVAGTPVADSATMKDLIDSHAGTAVRIDLLRGETPMSVTAQLNRPQP
jgi:hypothetical protein